MWLGVDGCFLISRMCMRLIDRMGFEEGLKLLQELGARPDALYWEGFPHEDKVLATLKLVQKVGQSVEGCVDLSIDVCGP